MRIQDPNDHFIDYQIRDLPHRKMVAGKIEDFEVTKWTGNYAPARSYFVSFNRDQVSCDCPDRRQEECKHIKMVREYLRQGKPATFQNLVEDLFLE